MLVDGDELAIELWQYTALGFDKLVATLGTARFPRNWWYFAAPKQWPAAYPAPDKAVRVFFVVRKATNDDITSKVICLFCSYPMLTCTVAIRAARGRTPLIVCAFLSLGQRAVANGRAADRDERRRTHGQSRHGDRRRLGAVAGSSAVDAAGRCSEPFVVLNLCACKESCWRRRG